MAVPQTPPRGAAPGAGGAGPADPDFFLEYDDYDHDEDDEIEDYYFSSAAGGWPGGGGGGVVAWLGRQSLGRLHVLRAARRSRARGASAAGRARIVLGNRRMGENGFMRSGRK
jgi:hypothetical protein